MIGPYDLVAEGTARCRSILRGRSPGAWTAVTHPQSQLAGLLAVLLAGGAGPQTPPDRPAASPGAATPPAAGAQDAPFPGPPTADPTGQLLREGSYILRTRGTLDRDAETGWWTFRIARDDPHQRIGGLTLLPCTLLANLEQLVESMPRQEIVFDLTGQVFVYRGRNFLLPTHAPRLVEYVPPTRGDAGQAAETPPPGDESAQAILRDLEQTVGPVLHSSRAGPAAAAPDGPQGVKLLPPGTVMLWRRGWMVRETGGAWSFVFQADATGLADPPMVLLPCLLLEEMERHARRSGPRQPLLVSGRVERYHGRNYLLPTSYQVPRDHTPLRP
jgi:hypothetical protein